MHTPETSLKHYRQLATGKGRQETGAFLVEGEKAIKQIATGNPDAILEILTVSEPSPAYRQYPIRTITEKQCRYVCSTQTPQGIAAVVRIPEEIYTDRLPDNPGRHVLLLDDIQDPGNAGTLIRMAAAFDYQGIIMSGKCADPLSPKCVQAATGATLSTWIRRTDGYAGLAKELKADGYTILAADLSGDDSPESPDYRSKFVLALGNEAAGLSEEILKLADYRLRIPIKREKAESLNVAACGAILMYASTQAEE